MATDVNCPQCGEPITRTLGCGLQHADPAWLRRQASAIPLLVAISIVTLLERFSYFPEAFLRYIGSLSHIVAAVAVLVACFRLSALEPSPVTNDESPIRRGLLVAAILFVLLNVATLDIFTEMRVRFYPSVSWLLGAQQIVLAVTDFLALLLLSNLARRSDSPSLRTQSRRLLYAVPLITVAPLITEMLPNTTENRTLTATVYVIVHMVIIVIMCVLPLFLGQLYQVLRTSSNAPRTPLPS